MAAGLYPSIEDVFNACRVHLNDSQTSAGRVFTDTWQPSITILNLALARFGRDLETFGVSTTREEEFIASLPPIDGPNGVSAPDPDIQPYLSFAGFFDGLTLHAGITLPADLLIPLKIEERDSGSDLPYSFLSNQPDGLVSALQGNSLGGWEWRGDKIFFNGSIIEKDIRLRYTAGIAQYALALAPSSFPTTMIPYLDSQEPLAYLCAYIFDSPRTGGAASELLANYQTTMRRVANRAVRMMQRTPVSRRAFGDYAGEGWGP